MMKRLFLLFFVGILIFSFSLYGSAETFYSWDIYEDLNLDVNFNITSNANYEVADPALYSSIISDLQENFSEYGVEKYEFVYYFRHNSGSGVIKSPVLRFGSLSPVSADSGTGIVTLNSSNASVIYPFTFSVPADKVGLYTPRLQFYITLSSSATELDFTLTGISCKAVRTAPPSDIRLLEQINNNTYLLHNVLCLFIAIFTSFAILKAFKRIFYSALGN